MARIGLLGKRRYIRVLLLAAGSLLAVGCSRPNLPMVKQLSDLQSPGGAAGDRSGASIQELRQEVAKYQGEVNRVYENTKKLGHFYEMLALKYFDLNMYGPALRSFKEAITIHPQNPVLYYMAGLCQAQLAKADVDPSEQKKMFEEAARYYQNALNINGGFKEALFALSVLDVFELDRTAAAEPLLKQLVSLDPKDTNALFLLARVYAGQGQAQAAAAVYDKIIGGTATSEQKSRAEENKQKVLEGAFGR